MTDIEKHNMIYNLINLANKLDQNIFYKEANFIDNLLKQGLKQQEESEKIKSYFKDLFSKFRIPINASFDKWNNEYNAVLDYTMTNEDTKWFNENIINKINLPNIIDIQTKPNPFTLDATNFLVKFKVPDGKLRMKDIADKVRGNKEIEQLLRLENEPAEEELPKLTPQQQIEMDWDEAGLIEDETEEERKNWEQKEKEEYRLAEEIEKQYNALSEEEKQVLQKKQREEEENQFTVGLVLHDRLEEMFGPSDANSTMAKQMKIESLWHWYFDPENTDTMPAEFYYMWWNY